MLPLHTLLFFFTPPATTDIYTLSLHDALPIFHSVVFVSSEFRAYHELQAPRRASPDGACVQDVGKDRKSTRLNSSHVRISYAVFCLKKKKPPRFDRVAHVPVLDAVVAHLATSA